MPFNVSNPVLYYNKALFEKAGLDPEQPPATLDEMQGRRARRSSRVEARRNSGIALKTDSGCSSMARQGRGSTIVEQRQRAHGPGDEGDLRRRQTGISLFTWIDDMVQSQARARAPAPSDYNHYLAVGNGTAAMTIDTSAALGTISQRARQRRVQRT